ncbi:hypothetical protein B0T16DRAFT_451263 [Cercophora newfieldiana]|uniref:GATA-type domain-containing protein n=1 Tax=Cercophora newfieldiana TaxID=92897 RepID=A0AA39YNB6_9PEZI|nr:hypothetical protein B0T16DRAFT_451263 [Cercophora newfieldiana]
MPASLSLQPLHPVSPHQPPRPSNPEVDPAPPDESTHLFGIEKAFWKIQNSAQELLRFAATYHQHHQLTGDRTALPPLPREIDMLSMTQLSWGILHAVSDINNHNQRVLVARHGLAWRRRHMLQQQRAGGVVGRVVPGGRVKKEPRTRRVLEKGTKVLDGCVECGTDESPRWRRGPAGRLTLCNVCGLLFAKRAQVQQGQGQGQGQGQKIEGEEESMVG